MPVLNTIGSRFIQLLGWNRDTEELGLLLNGAWYDYYHVPGEVYEELVLALDKGRYFNRYIRGKYEYRRG